MITFALPTSNAIARAFFTKIGSPWTKSVDMRATSGGTISDSHSRRFATWAFSFEPLGRNPQIAAATHISTFFVHDDPKSRKNAHSETAPDRRADIGTPHIRRASSSRQAEIGRNSLGKLATRRGALPREPARSDARTSAKASTPGTTGSEACNQARYSPQEP